MLTRGDSVGGLVTCGRRPLPETLIIQVSQGENVARFRKAVIAAVALSALALTPTAAYAHDHGVSGETGVALLGSEGSSMGWAHYLGDLIDVSTSDDVFEGARATAVMIGMEGSSYLRLHISGIKESASGKEYPAHLHEGPCVAGDGAAAGGHYNTQKEAQLPSPWLVSDQTEVHLDFEVNPDGYARTTVNVPFVPKPGVRSIVIHTDETPLAGSSPARLACLPLTIKVFAGAR
jgi:Cu/Zn superoxide dismutase